MHKLVLALALAPALAAAALPAAASDKQKTYAVYMPISCEAFTQERWDRNGVRYKQIQAWISGYVTAFNGWQANTHDILGGSDVSRVESWVEGYCRTHPLNNLSNAMAELLYELNPSRQRTAIDFAH
jgi:hypothetical protein